MRERFAAPPAARGIVSPVEWRGDHLEVVDQTLLPERLEVLTLRTVAEVVDAIRRLAVRGAPLIGLCGAFGVVIGLEERRHLPAREVRAGLTDLERALGGARPTAVNLSWAVGRTIRAARRGASPRSMRDLGEQEALRIREENRESCLRIAEFGRAELASARRILTHCNTGRLATAGVGTALGIVYAKAGAGQPVEVLATETRPLLQGSRLTAWELAQAGIPVTLVSDGAGGAAMAAGIVDAVVVGCDRVAANGDTANKIGTYPLAVLAGSAGIPFYVAGPMSSFDLAVERGDEIVLEQRPADEVRRVGDCVVAPDVAVWNPAFDVTPAGLVTAFVTDVGVLRPPFRESIALAMREAERLGLRGR